MRSAPGTRPHPPDGAGTHRGRSREDGAFRSRVRDRQGRAAGHGNSSAYRHLEEDETRHAKALGSDRESTPRSGCSLKPARLQAWRLGLEKKHQEERVPASHVTLGSPAANTTTEKCFACSLCYAKFAREDHLSVHTRTHTDEKPFSCSVCSAKFNVESFLSDHIKTHTRKELFSCSLCSAQFTKQIGLDVHMRTHNDGKVLLSDFRSAPIQKCDRKMRVKTPAVRKTFTCPLCCAKFTENVGFNIHVRTHSSEKLFPCLICSAKFSVRSFLNDHVKTHTCAKLFSCSTCSAQFNVKSYLNEHIKTHTGEKLFACSECSAKFTTLIGLNVHMRTHTG
ncbi:zinc finger protein 26-like isoform X2 [Bacillus rossius redtenbacheri]|uniref:zinc finger protein 26-like isoform X2 n=1 Tax=Bacillus rossius redtenbacheri TaxID=93214 RepID=UPI002FDE45D3